MQMSNVYAEKFYLTYKLPTFEIGQSHSYEKPFKKNKK